MTICFFKKYYQTIDIVKNACQIEIVFIILKNVGTLCPHDKKLKVQRKI